MTAVYFAWNYDPVARKTLREWNWDEKPLNVLVALPYLRSFMNNEPEDRVLERSLNTMLDSGAFSVWKSGGTVDIDELIDVAKGGAWDEVVALDVIGDSDASVRNAQYMKERGCQVMPVFHYGEDWGVLRDYCLEFDRVGLSCSFVKQRQKSRRWVEQCFARQWPHLFHSFGWVADSVFGAVPFDTADASSWHTGPAVYGRWMQYGGINLGVRTRVGSGLGFGGELEHYLRMQQRAEDRWLKELTPLRTRVLGPERAARRTLPATRP